MGLTKTVGWVVFLCEELSFKRGECCLGSRFMWGELPWGDCLWGELFSETATRLVRFSRFALRDSPIMHMRLMTPTSAL